MDTIAAPLVPPELDLQDFPFIPLYIQRLLKSRSWLICKRRPELAFYMINLWMGAWHAQPASSLEDDPDALADLARCDPSRWDSVKDDVLRGWKKCESDGRLYHKVVAELALEAWASKLEQRRNTLKARLAKAEKRLEKTTDQITRQEVEGQITAMRQTLSQSLSQPLSQSLSQNTERGGGASVAEENLSDVERPPITPTPVAASRTEPVTAPATGSKRKGQGEGQGKGTKETPHSPPEGGGRVPRRFRAEGGEVNTPEERERNLWIVRIKQWLSSDYWGPMWGPKHGQPGFQGPKDFAAMSVDELRAAVLGSAAA